MGSENAKVRVGIYIEKAILEQADGLLETANVRSRNEFVAEALKFYMGYLLAGKAENYFLQSLASVLTGTVQDNLNQYDTATPDRSYRVVENYKTENAYQG